MSGKREKKVEYKETELFELFPKFSYTAQQKKRVMLFHGYWKNMKKTINYAANFDEPNQVCLVYLVGDIEEGKTERALKAAGCSDRVCVVTARFPEQAMSVWRAYDELRKELTGISVWDKEMDAPTREYLTERKRSRDYYAAQMRGEVDGQYGMPGASEDPELSARMIREYDAMMDVIRRYTKLKAQSEQKTFWEFRLHRAGHLEKPYTHDRLDSLIKKIYPSGAEAQGAGRTEFLSPSAVAPAIIYGKTGEASSGNLKLTEAMLVPAVKALTKLITKKLLDKGYCTLSEIRDEAAMPPLGLAYDGFSAACIARTLTRFGNRTLLLYDGVSTFEAAGHERSIFDMMFFPVSRRSLRLKLDRSCLYLESQPHKKVKQFMSRLWGVKVRMPGTLMGLYLGRDLCGTHRVPLRYVDDRLFQLTLWDLDFWDRQRVKELADEIERHGEEILSSYDRYKEVNANVPENAASLLTADYSWCWTREQYEDILWQTQKYGPWPWDWETQNKVYAESEKRRLSLK